MGEKVAYVTHYALLVFGGDFDGDHPDEELRGHGPKIEFLAAGPEDFCWDRLARWTEKHPLRRDEIAEVVTRHPSMLRYVCVACRGVGRVSAPPDAAVDPDAPWGIPCSECAE